MAGVALAPPTETVSAETAAQYEKEMVEAANAPLPDEDDQDL